MDVAVLETQTLQYASSHYDNADSKNTCSAFLPLPFQVQTFAYYRASTGCMYVVLSGN